MKRYARNPKNLSPGWRSSPSGIPVTKVILTPNEGGESLSIIYRSHNHLSDENPLDADDVEHFSTVLAPGQSLMFPYRLEFAPEERRETEWQRTGESNVIPKGKYQMKAELIVDRQVSEWKGVLTSGLLEVDIQRSDLK